MRGLLLKDVFLLKNQKRFFLIFLFAAAGMLFANLNPAFVINYVTIIFAMFTLSTISYDEFDNGYAYLFTLPITRKQYVAEKYVFGFLVGGSVCLVVSAFALIVTFFRTGIVDVGVLTPAFFSLLIMFLFFCAVLPLQLKFGAEKGRIVLVFFIGAIFAIGYVLANVVKDSKVDVSAAIEAMTSLNQASVIGLLFVISVAAVCLSYLLSVKIMQKKQF